MENVVFLHLKIQVWSITVGQSEQREVDFIAQKNGEKNYIQVAYMLDNENPVAREFGNLLAIPDNFPKMVVTMDKLIAGASYKGIQQIHLLDFLSREF